MVIFFLLPKYYVYLCNTARNTLSYCIYSIYYIHSFLPVRHFPQNPKVQVNKLFIMLQLHIYYILHCAWDKRTGKLVLCNT